MKGPHGEVARSVDVPFSDLSNRPRYLKCQQSSHGWEFGEVTGARQSHDARRPSPKSEFTKEHQYLCPYCPHDILSKPYVSALEDPIVRYVVQSLR